MCAPSAPKPPPPPPPPPDFTDEQAALAVNVEQQRQRQLFAGLNSTIATGASGVLAPARTTANPRPGGA